ncbi:MAG: hypothetical protein H0X31_00285 [Nostocaceae cyanobacterium]|nr:hypothetical protein [Nostocaceae cyanobacterium]
MRELNFIFPRKAKDLTLSTQTILRVVRSIISYNNGELQNHVFQLLFIDFTITNWVAENILDRYVFKAFCHPLLVQQVLIKLESEISDCHRLLEITEKSRIIRVSEFSQTQIISSIQKLYMERTRRENNASTKPGAQDINSQNVFGERIGSIRQIYTQTN